MLHEAARNGLALSKLAEGIRWHGICASRQLIFQEGKERHACIRPNDTGMTMISPPVIAFGRSDQQHDFLLKIRGGERI